ncbi:MAG: Gar1/Naf1 family protein [Candidatus Methanomethyliaceae archaeon]|nr:Gar1/Naf1 family protein [Candidatus Methanomethyliaceae archaeon]MDW7970894.1 Gar1/Naf1 family protein [Nitrososphaerota archaeon]
MGSFYNDTLHEIGRILHISRSNLILAKVKVPSRIGSFVYLKDGRKLGEIIDIFGPISSPYALIKPFKKTNENEVVGASVYLRELSRRRRK